MVLSLNTMHSTNTMHNTNTNAYTPVILCGGSGSRLYPLSRNSYPKQFLNVSSTSSLLENTISRFKDVDHIILITNIAHKNIVVHQITRLKTNIRFTIISEPEGRNTLPAVSIVCKYFPNHTLLFIPCDHVYDTGELMKTINDAVNIGNGQSPNPIIIFGIKPTYPETGFGYILNTDDSTLVKFLEKPNYDKACELIQDPCVLWNSGMFLINSHEFIQLLSVLKNDFDKQLDSIVDTYLCAHQNSPSHTNQYEFIDIPNTYKDLENVSIDHGIMEKIDLSNIKVPVVKYNGLWSDIGSFKAIYDIGEKDAHGNCWDRKPIANNSSNCLIKSDKLVLLNGVKNLSIVETNDVLLVSDLAQSQDVKLLYQLAVSLGCAEVNYNNFDYRPWGWYEVLAGGDNMGFKIKRIIVEPHKRLSLQSHAHGKEYWFGLNGFLEAQIGSGVHMLEKNTMCFIDIGVKHRLINNTDDVGEIIEIQLGTWLGEDDIVRYEDDFQRVNT